MQTGDCAVIGARCTDQASKVHGRLLAMLMAVLALSICRAQDPYGMVRTPNENVTIITDIVRFTPQQEVSGTNVQFTTNCQLDAPNPGYWTSQKIKSVQVKIDGEEVLVYTPPDSRTVQNFIVRFDSSHFAHNSVQQVELKLEYILFHESEQSTGTQVSIVELKMYNVAQLWATTEEVNPQTGEFTVGGPYSNEAIDGASAGHPAFASINHAVRPAQTSDDTSIRELTGPYQLKFLLKESTVVFAFTHGQGGSFRSSAVDEISVTEARYYVQGNPADPTQDPLRTKPRHNLVLMIACRTTQGSFERSFQITSPQGAIEPDRSYLGFTDYVYSLTSEGEGLSQFTKLLVAELCSGSTLKEAVDRAFDKQATLQMVNGTWEKRPPVISGDPECKIRTVYLNAADKLALGSSYIEARKKWYYFYDPATRS